MSRSSPSPKSDRNHSVFVNCPHTPDYANLRDALTLAVLATGHYPTYAYNVDPTMPPTQITAERLDRSRYSLHECSPCCNVVADDLRRHNLPLELGMAFQERRRTDIPGSAIHEVMLLLKGGHPYKDFLLGLNSGQLISYSGRPTAMSRVFDWLKQMPTRTFAPDFQLVQVVWREFQAAKPKTKVAGGKKPLSPEEAREILIAICGKHEFWRSEFDVFLAHNSKDKEHVMTISSKLRENNINPWLDEEQVKPGRSFIEQIDTALPNCKAAAIFFSAHGLGDWETRELEVFLIRSVQENIPVIPVLLPGFDGNLKLPGFLQSIRNVRFNDLDDPDPLGDLTWGITGERH